MFALKDRKNLKHPFTLKFVEKTLKKKHPSMKIDYDKLTISAADDGHINKICQDIIQALGPHKWKHLKTLTLDLTSSGGSNNIHLLRTLEIILNFNSELENLKLIFKNRSFSDPLLKSLGCLIAKALPKLKNLSIDLSTTYRGSEESLGILTSQIQKMTKLERLTLYANSWLNVNNAHISHFGSILGRVKSLEYLDLSFSQCHGLGDEGVEFLLSKINKNLVRLQGLGLNLMGCMNLTDRSLKALGLDINSKPRKFTQLKLNFAACQKISDEGVMSLGYGIGNYLENLEKLHLSFYCCQLISDKSFQPLILEICKHSATLHHLDLNFYGCSRISQAGFQTLATEFGATLKNLQRLALNFSMNLNITDSELELLADQISKNINDLRQLSLSFSACKRISDKGLDRLASEIYTQLTKLQKIYLFINDCPEITDEGIRTIATKINTNLPELTYFRFGFIINSKQVTIAILSFLKQTLGHIPGFNLQCY